MRTSLIAGLIGIALVMLFMLIVYRIPGLVASIALCFYMVIEALIFSLVRVNLSLPGIAGIILSIGMAVDANVIIFERVKEELKNGKTVKSAIDSGFKRAFTAILDSNITTLIAWCGAVLPRHRYDRRLRHHPWHRRYRFHVHRTDRYPLPAQPHG